MLVEEGGLLGEGAAGAWDRGEAEWKTREHEVITQAFGPQLAEVKCWEGRNP